MKTGSIFFLLLLWSFGSVYSQDRIFNYTYQSTVLNKSQKEIEVWTTLHNGRNKYYSGLDHRLEFEVGLGGKLQTAFYLNYGYSKGITETNGIETLIISTDYSFSNEWKYKLTDPVANKIGSAVYFEYGLSPSETELEGKIILDKVIGRTIHAFNLTGEYEIEKEFENKGVKLETETEGEASFELGYAFAYKLKEGLYLGLEARNQNQFSTNSEWENSVLSIGPSLSYNTNGFWVNLIIMPQITNLKTNRLELDEHEKLQARLVFSFAL